MSHQLTKQNCHPHNQTNVPSSWWWTDWLIACCCCCCSKLSDLTQDMLFSPWVVAVQKANYCMERNVSRFLQFWMRGRQREKREGKVLSCRSHAAFFLPCSETLTGGDKHIWGIGQNCKIGLQMILAWPKKIFAACNCAITPPFMLKTVCATMLVLKSKAWLFVPVVLQSIFINRPTNEMMWCPCLAICLGHFGMKRCNLPASAFCQPHCTSTSPIWHIHFWAQPLKCQQPNSCRFISSKSDFYIEFELIWGSGEWGAGEGWIILLGKKSSSVQPSD